MPNPAAQGGTVIIHDSLIKSNTPVLTILHSGDSICIKLMKAVQISHLEIGGLSTCCTGNHF